MEMVAIVGGIFSLIFAGVFLLDECGFVKEVKLGLVLALLFQLFWFPQTFETRTETETHITNKQQSYIFEHPVKITKTRTYKPFSVVDNETTYTVEFIRGE